MAECLVPAPFGHDAISDLSPLCTKAVGRDHFKFMVHVLIPHEAAPPPLPSSTGQHSFDRTKPIWPLLMGVEFIDENGGGPGERLRKSSEAKLKKK